MMASIMSVILSMIVLSGVIGTSLSKLLPLHIIKTETGQIYDCVDFHKQPAFNHPLSKNLATQVIIPPAAVAKPHGIGLSDGCPYGTVPILRSPPASSQVGLQFGETQTSPKKKCYAIITASTITKFLGASGAINIYKPVVYNDNQWSSSRVKLVNGHDNIEAGWMVYPKLFNDHEAHLFVRFTASGKGCLNNQCPGFVHVATNIPLGMIPSHYSTHDAQYCWDIYIAKQKDDGHWWLSIGLEKSPVGYWPSTLFTALADGAKTVEWGGEIYNPGPTNPPPQMGSGHQAVFDTGVSAAITNVIIIDDNFQSVIDPKPVATAMNCNDLYTVIDGGYVGAVSGHVLFYGGALDG